MSRQCTTCEDKFDNYMYKPINPMDTVRYQQWQNHEKIEIRHSKWCIYRVKKAAEGVFNSYLCEMQGGCIHDLFDFKM